MDGSLNRLLTEMRSIQREISSAIIEAVNNRKTDPKYWAVKQAKIDPLYKRFVMLWSVFAKGYLPEAYHESETKTIGILERAGIKRIVHKKKTHSANLLTSAAPPPDDSRVSGSVNAIIRDSIAVMQMAADGGMKNVQRLFHATQQQAISEVKINDAIAAGMQTDNTPRAIAKNIQQELEDAMEGGQVLSINGKNWQIDTYSEVVARTRSREAQTAAAKDTMLEYGQDLVTVVDADPCPICQEFVGNVYSITGSSDSYDDLTDEPPFHPNCQCVLAPFIEKSASEED